MQQNKILVQEHLLVLIVTVTFTQQGVSPGSTPSTQYNIFNWGQAKGDINNNYNPVVGTCSTECTHSNIYNEKYSDPRRSWCITGNQFPRNLENTNIKIPIPEDYRFWGWGYCDPNSCFAPASPKYNEYKGYNCYSTPPPTSFRGAVNLLTGTDTFSNCELACDLGTFLGEKCEGFVYNTAVTTDNCSLKKGPINLKYCARSPDTSFYLNNYYPKVTSSIII